MPFNPSEPLHGYLPSAQRVRAIGSQRGCLFPIFGSLPREPMVQVGKQCGIVSRDIYSLAGVGFQNEQHPIDCSRWSPSSECPQLETGPARCPRQLGRDGGSRIHQGSLLAGSRSLNGTIRGLRHLTALIDSCMPIGLDSGLRCVATRFAGRLLHLISA